MKHLFIILLLAFATNAHAQEPATKWSNFNAQIVEGTDGTGITDDPYIITSAGQLAFLAVMSNSTIPAENAYRNRHFQLAALTSTHICGICRYLRSKERSTEWGAPSEI